MATTVTITIPAPVLSGTDIFHVKYKLTTSPTWIAIGDQTNAAFTITGLSDGDYQLSITIASSPDCPEVLECFTISTCKCPTISNVAITTTNQINHLNFDLVTTNSGSPSTEDWPPCGLRIVITDISGAITTFIVSRPSDLTATSANHYTFSQVVTGDQYTVNVYVNCCAESGLNTKLCGTYTVQIAQSPVTCQSFRTAFQTPHGMPDGSGGYLMPLTIYNSVPACDTFTISYIETFTYLTPDSGTYNLSGALAIPVSPAGTIDLLVPVTPNADDYGGNTYHGSITDCCGNTINFF